MADVDIREFLPLVRQHAPSAPVPLAIEHIRQAAIEFCIRTRCWRHSVTLAVTANPTQITTPINAVVHEIEQAEFEDVSGPLQPASYRDFSTAEIAEPAGESPPVYFTQEHPDEVILIPCKAGDLTLRLFLKPPAAPVFDGNAARQTLPDFMHNHHAQFLAFGALASLLTLPDEAFMDKDRAVPFRAQFDARMDAMSSQFRSGQQRRRARTGRSPFLTTSSLGLSARRRRW